MSAESDPKNLPFEPKTKRQKPAKAKNQPPVVKQGLEKKEQDKQLPFTKEEMAIPKVVSQRMIRRVAAFCGIPTFLGISTLVISYLLVTFAHIKLAPIAVLLVNLGFFGLGVLGITYGTLSASWDEDRTGTWLGWNEFTTNWGRMVNEWRATKQNKQKKA
jgi:Photosynthesis affected mutant 68